LVAESLDNAVALKVDSADRAAVRAGILEVVERYGRLDILVNNAGVTRVGTIDAIGDRDYDESVAINLTASSPPARRRYGTSSTADGSSRSAASTPT
jgi:3-oxoacyl-[acyl-carrier protein] reductase